MDNSLSNDPFQISEATREYGDEFGTRNSPPKTSPKFNFPWIHHVNLDCIFRVSLSGVQCRNLQARKIRGTSDPFVEFYWDDMKEPVFTTPTIKGDLNPTWKGVNCSFEFKACTSQLKEKKLQVKVYSNRRFSSKSLIGTTSIDLFTIATGPVHHDHHLKGCDNGRVVFNCYMEQFSDWEISVKNVGAVLPAIQDEIDRPEGHDFQEDADLPLRKYAVSYKCTIGTNETLYMGNNLKNATQQSFVDQSIISFQALARLRILASRKGAVSRQHSSHAHSQGPNDEEYSDSADKTQDPVVVDWNLRSDALPSIKRYSTFDELMSATLKIEIRTLMVGRGQISSEPDTGFIHMLEKYGKEMNNEIDEDMKSTWLYGQSWLSLEKLFEDAMQKRSTQKTFDDNSAHYVESKFEQTLALKGHQVGFLYGTIVFRKIPDVRQMRSGVISENGISASSSVIVGLPSKKHTNRGKVILPEEAQRVLEKMEGLFQLMSTRYKDEKESKIRKATKILRVLQTSHKASMLSWVYANNEALDETKVILMRLWEFLLENIRVRDYTLRNIFYELLFYLVKRAELSDLPLLGFDSVAFNASGNMLKPLKKDLEFGLKLRAMLIETKCCVLQAVAVRGVMNNNFMFFVARMLSFLCFRLPSFGVELYQLWAQSYIELVDELDEEFRLSAGADLFAMDGLEAHLDWRRFHKALYDEYGEKILKRQEEDAEDKYEMATEKYHTRFLRLQGESNTLNVLLADQWMWYVLDTLAVLNQKIGWMHIPGYAQVVKVFFLELRSQKNGPLSPALYKLSCTMLSNTSLINPMTKMLLSTTSVHNVPAVIAAVELLGVWMYMIRSWRVRLSSYRLSHLENNDRWNFHQDTQYSIPAGDEVALLPPAFDFRFLCSALRILLTSEHTQVILTTLEFLYNCWDCFPERQADKLRYELLQVFLRFFLHWHGDVRHFFLTLIAFRAVKSHAWTQQGASFVDTPPHSRRHIDAVAADFASALGPDEVFDSTKRPRSSSTSNLMDSVKRLGETLSSPRAMSLTSPKGSQSSPKGSSFSSPRSSLSSPRNSLSSPRNSLSSPRGFSDRKYSDGYDRSDRKSRSISEDFTRNDIQPAMRLQQKMDPTIQLQFNKLLESIYSAAKKYISTSEDIFELESTSQAKVNATWKKKGSLLKQGFLYKNTWQQKFFSLRNNKLAFSDTDGGSIRREISIKGAKIVELPNQIDQTHGTRLILHNCFSVDNGYQKLTLCAPTYDEMREWMDVLIQNSVASTVDEEGDDASWNISDVSYELEGVAGKVTAGEDVDETLMPYTAVATKEWLAIRVNAMDVESRIAAGQPFTLPVLLSKSSSYDDDV